MGEGPYCRKSDRKMYMLENCGKEVQISSSREVLATKELKAARTASQLPIRETNKVGSAPGDSSMSDSTKACSCCGLGGD